MEKDTSAPSATYDQYEQYDCLPKLLKRYTFYEKMCIANIYSSKSIMQKQAKEDRRLVFPWCLETFIMLAMEAEEYGDGDFKGKNESKAIKMFNAIWNATSEVLQRSYGKFNTADMFLQMTLLSQIPHQEIDWIIMYRYWYIFNFTSDEITLRNIFEKKMGATYEDYLLFGEALRVLYFVHSEQPRVSISRKMLEYLLFKRFPQISSNMMISREKYVHLQRKYINDSSDIYKYVYSLCPSVQYPLVEFDGDIYLPLPHLLVRSVTSSLLYRVTEGDDELRGKIGKHVWERYLYDIIYESGAYQEVSGEQKYRNSKPEKYGPDVMARQGKDVLFLDSKSTVPKVGVRNMDEEANNANIRMIGEYISKLVKHIWVFEEYSPFADASYDMEHHWGVVVVLEDSFIQRKYYYEQAQRNLGLSNESKEWQWVLRHIRVASLYTIERISLAGQSVLEACRDFYDGDPYSYALTCSNQSFKPENKKAIDFNREHTQKLQRLMEEAIKDSGIGA